jgi:hypothetical protein
MANPADDNHDHGGAVLTTTLWDRTHRLFDALDPHTAANVEPFVREHAGDLTEQERDDVIATIRSLDPGNLTSLFVFDRKAGYEQVAPFIGEYAKVRAEILGQTGRSFVYNDELIDRIPGIANKEKRGPNVGSHEEAAIYKLQCLFRWWEQEAKIMDLLARGYEHIERLATDRERFAHVVLYPTRDMGGEWAEHRDCRLVWGDAEKTPAYVLPKGARSRGFLISGRAVLVLR